MAALLSSILSILLLTPFCRGVETEADTNTLLDETTGSTWKEIFGEQQTFPEDAWEEARDQKNDTIDLINACPKNEEISPCVCDVDVEEGYSMDLDCSMVESEEHLAHLLGHAFTPR